MVHGRTIHRLKLQLILVAYFVFFILKSSSLALHCGQGSVRIMKNSILRQSLLIGNCGPPAYYHSNRFRLAMSIKTQSHPNEEVPKLKVGISCLLMCLLPSTAPALTSTINETQSLNEFALAENTLLNCLVAEDDTPDLSPASGTSLTPPYARPRQVTNAHYSLVRTESVPRPHLIASAPTCAVSLGKDTGLLIVDIHTTILYS